MERAHTDPRQPPAAPRPALHGGERFLRLLEKSAEGILVLDLAGLVQYVNPAAALLFGRGVGDLLGTRFGFPVVAGEAGKVDLLPSRGDPLPVEMRVVTTEWEGAPALLVSLRDVTAERRLAAEQRTSEDRRVEVERLREQDAFKARFISTSAHELGTPLTPIRMQIQLLQAYANRMPPEALHNLAVLARNVDRLTRLIDDMLEAARIQAGRVHLDVSEADLVRLAKEATESYMEAAQRGGVTLVLEAPVPLPVPADAKRIAQVLDNLLDNALKFTPIGGRVTVDARRHGSLAVLSVTDTGRGLRPEDLPKLFQAYSQVRDGVVRRGTGLGLYICKGIVEAHGGTIACSSPGLGHGSVFTLTLPLHETAQGVGASEEA